MASSISSYALLCYFANGSESFYPGGCVASPDCQCWRCMCARGETPTPKSDQAAAERAANEFAALCVWGRRALGYEGSIANTGDALSSRASSRLMPMGSNRDTHPDS